MASFHPVKLQTNEVFHKVKLIEEVKKRPGLYLSDKHVDREEKLALWKEVGAAIYKDWHECNKATVYDRVLQIQRKWRSLRDAYNRELRARRSGVRVNKRVYIYFHKMSFLGGFEGEIEEEENIIEETPDHDDTEDEGSVQEEPIDPLHSTGRIETEKKSKKKRRANKLSPRSYSPEQVEVEYAPDVSERETDSDKLFLMSFLPEMRQLPLNIKMWARAQIANIMQEAVTSHYNNTMPSDKSDKCTSGGKGSFKRQRCDSSEFIS